MILCTQGDGLMRKFIPLFPHIILSSDIIIPEVQAEFQFVIGVIRYIPDEENPVGGIGIGGFPLQR